MITPPRFASPLDVAHRHFGSAAHLAYATSLEALMAEHQVQADVAMVETDPGPTFTLDTGAGEPVLFVHGTPATSAVWMPLIPHLNDIRAILVDRPGHGLSGDFDYRTVPADAIRDHAVKYLESLLDALDLRSATFVASSYGGLWAMWLALDRPERVERLVLAGAPPGMLSPRLPLIFGLLSVPAIAGVMNRMSPPSARATRRFFRQMGDPVTHLDETVIQAFTDAQRLPGAASQLHNIQRAARFPGRFDHRSLWLDAADLARITQSTRFLWGPKDFLGDPDHGRRIVDAMPDAELQVIGTGHLPWLQDPSGVARAVERTLAG